MSEDREDEGNGGGRGSGEEGGKLDEGNEEGGSVLRDVREEGI